jgi:hypothetical protein
MTSDGLVAFAIAVLGKTGIAHEGVAAPSAIALPIPIATASFIVELFIVLILSFAHATAGGEFLVGP